MKKFLAVLLSCALFAAPVYAIESFVVRDIRVVGLQRISAGTVFNYLPIKVGDTVTEVGARDAIKALFKTGFFKDVRLDRSGSTLVVTVAERPSIDSIKITGSKELDEATLKKGLKQVGLAEGRVLDSSVLDRTEQELKSQYFARGHYAVQVKTMVTPLPRNRVAIKIAVSEGRVAKIQQIDIVGNHSFSDKELLGTFKLSTPKIFSFLTKHDQYSQQQLEGDLENLRSFYQNRGFLEFNIDSTQVSITPDKQQIFITVNISEGKRYRVSGYKLAGTLILPEKKLRTLISIKPGDVFSRQEVIDSSKRISDRLGDDGYAFANVNAIPDINHKNDTVSFTFFVDPGHRVYVRRVNFFGNNATDDEVLRREMRQFEGAWFSASKIKRSRERLQRLGFFDDVNIETPAVPGTSDQVDVNVTVKERLVNNFMAGIGYSDVEGLLLNANVTFKNLFGTGKQLSTSIDTSSYDKHVDISYVNPYYTIDGVSRSVSVYESRINASAANIAAYNSNTVGAGVLYGIPISENRTISVGLAFERVALSVNSTSALVAQNFVNNYGSDNSVVKANFGWDRNTLDDPIFPTKGTFERASAEVAVPGSDLEYYLVTLMAGAYHQVGKRYSVKVRGEYDYGDGYGNTQDLPFYKNFYAGGSSTVRGYRADTLGPKDVNGPYPTLPIGGNRRILGNASFLFPVPGTAPDNKSMRLSVFSDAGMVYGPGDTLSLGQLRYSAGLAFHWYSPVGPLSLSLAAPLNKKPGDNTEAFQFTLGTSFQ
ncbi:MAG: outer membrane protein assembly factor BamA [Acidiferrobacterales bacterium]